MAGLMSKYTPKLNHDVMEGLACKYIPQAPEYIDRVFKSASKSFPAGLVYVGYERCSPIEEFEELTKPKNNKRSTDLAKTDLYLMRYKFTFEGVPVPDKYIYLPFVNDGGVLSLRGARYHISPVLSDKVISPGPDSVFIRLLRDKITFRRCYHTVVIDGVRETTHVVWSSIYRKSKNGKTVPTTTKALTCIPHYLFCKYGVDGTFKRFAGIKPVIGGAEITVEKYPVSDWVITESNLVKPPTCLDISYQPSDVRVAIPRKDWNSLTKALTMGLFYAIDHFPRRLKAGHLNDVFIWRVLLGHIVFSGVYGENKLYQQISEHIASLDVCVDSIVVEQLAESNRHLNDFYDILAYVLKDFNELTISGGTNRLSMFGMSLDILYNTLYDITCGIFNATFKLSKLATKKQLIMRDVVEAFNKNIRVGAIFGLTSGEIVSEAVSYSGDHKYPKITSRLAEQETLPGSKRGKKQRAVIGEDSRFEASMMEAGSVLFLSKANPTPKAKINMFINLDLATGTIIPNPKFDAIREELQMQLSGKKPA